MGQMDIRDRPLGMEKRKKAKTNSGLKKLQAMTVTGGVVTQVKEWKKGAGMGERGGNIDQLYRESRRELVLPKKRGRKRESRPMDGGESNKGDG